MLARQVEAAIEQDPTNREWTKLKADLLEVIQLTSELAQVKASSSNAVQDEELKTYSIGEKCQAIFEQEGFLPGDPEIPGPCHAAPRPLFLVAMAIPDPVRSLCSPNTIRVDPYPAQPHLRTVNGTMQRLWRWPRTATS
jgi:hypothetical protein